MSQTLHAFFPTVGKKIVSEKKLDMKRMMLTRVKDGLSENSNHDCVSLPDLICGEGIEKVVLVSYLLEIPWVLKQCPCLERPDIDVTMVTQYSPLMEKMSRTLSGHLKLHLIRVPLYGCFHAKAILVISKEKIRVVIMTANLRANDWKNHTQGVWCRDFPRVEIPVFSRFGSYLEDFFVQMGNPGSVNFSMFDMSSVDHDTFLVASVPGNYTFNQKKYGAERVKDILKEKNDKEGKVVMQFSSFSTLKISWLVDYMGPCFGASEIQIIYPTQKNVENSVDGIWGGECLPAASRNSRNPELRPFLHRWSAEVSHRTRHTPHIKSYCKYNIKTCVENLRPTSECDVDWFLLTSANLSQSAWGVPVKTKPYISIKSFELGVLMFPGNENFKVPYDLPPIPFAPDDLTWTSDSFHQ